MLPCSASSHSLSLGLNGGHSLAAFPFHSSRHSTTHSPPASPHLSPMEGRPVSVGIAWHTLASTAFLTDCRVSPHYSSSQLSLQNWVSFRLTFLAVCLMGHNALSQAHRALTAQPLSQPSDPFTKWSSGYMSSTDHYLQGLLIDDQHHGSHGHGGGNSLPHRNRSMSTLT